MGGPARGGLWVEEHHRALPGAGLDAVWCVGRHDHLGAAVSGAAVVEHRHHRCRGDDLDGMVGVGIGCTD